METIVERIRPKIPKKFSNFQVRTVVEELYYDETIDETMKDETILELVMDILNWDPPMNY
jgi:hypothetical protein